MTVTNESFLEQTKRWGRIGTWSDTSFLEHVAPISTWGEWLKLADAATTYEQKLGLLHVGFDVEEMGPREKYGEPNYTPYDRLAFYFSVADGWTDSSNFRTKGLGWQDEPQYFAGWRDSDGVRRQKSQSEQRQLLAQKAFDMLVSNFFVKQAWVKEARFHSRTDEEKIRHLLGDPVFLIVQEFFRAEEGVIRNLAERHDNEHHRQKKVIEFLLWLPPLLWNWTEKEIRPYDSEQETEKKKQRNQADASIVAQAKLWMIEVLSALRELNVLDPWVLELDRPCLTRLTEIALRNTFRCHPPVSSDRPVATLDEACFLNSQAAWMVKKHGIMKEQYTLLQAISDAERQVEEARRKVAALTQQNSRGT